MTRFISFMFLCIYLTNQAAYALPASNSMMLNHEFKKKCKLGRKETISKYTPASDSKKNFIDNQKSVKKVISYCMADAHIQYQSTELVFVYCFPVCIADYKMSTYICFSVINAPPPSCSI